MICHIHLLIHHEREVSGHWSNYKYIYLKCVYIVYRSFYFESACTSLIYIELFLRINLLLVGFFRVLPVSVKLRDFVLLKWSWAGNTFLWFDLIALRCFELMRPGVWVSLSLRDISPGQSTRFLDELRVGGMNRVRLSFEWLVESRDLLFTRNNFL